MIFLINLCVAALFFFVSAYFVPASYTRAGGWPGFQAAKRWRLLIPALFFYGVVYPTSRLVGGYKSYHPFTGHTWFSWWLLLFNLAYASFPAKEITTEELAEPLADRRAPNAATTADPPAFFSTRFRTIAGLICSVSMVPWFLSSYYIANWYTGFALMPTPFLVTVYILMYYLGVQAANGRSLERPLTQQLDISPLSLLCHVVIPGITLVVAMGMAVAMEVVGWGEASRAWRERGPVGTKGALYSPPEARQMLSDRLWGAKVVGERHFGSGA